jgi:hypothetical protein
MLDLQLDLATLADVLVRRYPAAIRHRLIDDEDLTSDADLRHIACGLSLREGREQVATVLRGVLRKISLCLATFEQIKQRNARFYRVRG